jgi:predicted phage-related endonuclease
MPKINRSFTKDEINMVIDLWETKTLGEMAEALGRSIPSVTYIAQRIRKAGFNLSIKHVKGKNDSLVKTVLRERNLIPLN